MSGSAEAIRATVPVLSPERSGAAPLPFSPKRKADMAARSSALMNWVEFRMTNCISPLTAAWALRPVEKMASRSFRRHPTMARLVRV